MKYAWIDKYLLDKTGVTKDLQADWNWIRYQIGGKMFAAVCLDDANKPYYITLKLEPSEGDFLRTQYPDIVPGYYMNKMHWNSVKPDGNVPDDLLKESFLFKKIKKIILPAQNHARYHRSTANELPRCPRQGRSEPERRRIQTVY